MGVNTAFQFFNKNGDYLQGDSGFTDYGDVLSNSPIFDPILKWEELEITTHTGGALYSERYFNILELKFKIQKEDLDFFFFENTYNDSDKPKIHSVDKVIDKFNKYISIFDTEDFLGISVKNKNTNELVRHFPQNYPFLEIGKPFDNLIKEQKEYGVNYLNQLQAQNFYLKDDKKIDILFVEETTLKAYKNIIDDFSACLEKHRGYYMAGTWW